MGQYSDIQFNLTGPGVGIVDESMGAAGAVNMPVLVARRYRFDKQKSYSVRLLASLLTKEQSNCETRSKALLLFN